MVVSFSAFNRSMSEDVSTMNRNRWPSGAGAGALVTADSLGITGSNRQDMNVSNEASRRFISLMCPVLGALLLVVVTHGALHFIERTGDRADEVVTTRSHAAEAAHRVTLGKIVCHHQYIAVVLEPVSRPFDHLVCGLPGAAVKDFHVGRRGSLVGVALGTGAVKDNRDGRATGVAVLGKDVDQLLSGGRRVARFAGRKRRPTVQQAVSVHQYPHQSHTKRSLASSGPKLRGETSVIAEQKAVCWEN